MNHYHIIFIVYKIYIYLSFTLGKKEMRNLKLLLLITLLSISIAQQPIFYAPQSSQIILHGRYYIEGSDVKYDWCGFKIDFCFKNSKKVIWNLIDRWNIYHIIIDGKTNKVVHPKKDQKIIVYQSVNPQNHCIEIMKITQNHYGPIASRKDSVFKGIQIDSGSLVKNQRKYNYRFQFLGDSVTTAFGVMSGRNPICFFNMKNIQNCEQSWAVHLSSMFNADYRLQAVSGKGVVRNAFGVPGAKMPSLFTRYTDNSKLNSYKIQDHYVPDALFLFIGANDYNNIKNPSINNFVTGYTEMLRRILQDYMIYQNEGTKIINICDIEFNKQLCYNVQTAVKNFNYAYKHVYYLEIPQGTISKKQLGCIGHPNVEGQKRIARSVYEGVKEIMNK